MKKNTKKVMAAVLSGTMVLSSASGVFAAGPGAVTSTEVTQHEIDSAIISQQLATEGMVLLENKNNVLPMAGSGDVALYGAGAIQTIKGGTGSGAVNNRIVYPDGSSVDGVAIASTVLDGFKNAGYNVLTEDYLNAYNEANPYAVAGMGRVALPDDWMLTYEQVKETAAQTDTAIYVVRRNAGEGADRTPTKGDYYLSDAELANIQLLSSVFDKCIVVLNVISVDSSWFEESGADALVLMSNPGMLSGDALVQVLNGTVTPSGKLVDTWASDITDYPSTEYFAAINEDDPWSSFVEYYMDDIYVGYRYFDTFAPEKVNYEFGYGLSYTTFDVVTDSVTADKDKVTVQATVTNTGDTYSGKEVVEVYFSAPEGDLDKPYQELAAFGKTDTLAPGESQTLTLSFNTEEMSSYSEDLAAYIMEAGNYVIRVGNSSRNTEPAAVLTLDKTVITEQLTNQMVIDRDGANVGGSDNSSSGRGLPPYNQKIEMTKEENVENFNELREAFKEAGASAVAYDDGKSTENATVIELSGDELENTESVYPELAEGETYEDVNVYISATTDDVNVNGYNYETNVAYNVNPVYYDADGNATDTKPEEMANFRVKSGSEEDGTAEYYTLEDVANGVLTLEQFVSGMSIEELANMVEGGNKSPNADGQSAGGTSPSTKYLDADAAQAIDNLWVRGEAGETCGLYIDSRKIPNTTNADGPAGLRVTQSYEEDGTTYYQFCTAYPVGTMIAQSWDTEVARKMGEAVGADMIAAGVTLWLAPGMNIHRNPLCGRNFEYYSEDPLLSGSIASAEGSGVQETPGVGVTYKHYAANNQETTRNASNSVMSERALREIYLKGFEIAVKSSKPMAIMTSYNEINNVPAANDYELIENILRKEWGFDGLVMTDWGGSGGYSDARAMHAGNDLICAGKTVSNITGYITDAAPAIETDENGVATDGGYPFVSKTTRASGTTVTFTTVTHWGDYRPSAEGKEYTVETTTEAFDSETRPVRLYVDEEGNYYTTAQQDITTTQELQNWTIRELLDGKDINDAHLNGMVDDGTASYTEEDGKVVITYKLEKLSALDNVSTGHQEATTTDIFGDPDENTLTLGDLQKSVMNILHIVMASNQFADLTGTESVSYTQSRADQLQTYIEVAKSEIQ